MIHILLLLAFLSPVASEAEPLKIVPMAGGASSQIEEARTVVVRTAAEWTALWKEHAPDGKAPVVDFKQSMVLAVFSGTRPTAGHAIAITQVDARESEIIVTYTETQPRATEMVAQMLTTPFHIVRTDARAGKVTFKLAAAK